MRFGKLSPRPRPHLPFPVCRNTKVAHGSHRFIPPVRKNHRPEDESRNDDRTDSQTNDIADDQPNGHPVNQPDDRACAPAISANAPEPLETVLGKIRGNVLQFPGVFVYISEKFKR